ncbi:hypothetical protein [Burkholderia mayonis]|uniref:hypothetical protein n=1 Tax=Burkholderia mayonis TaxID=1385591 RepID=UPI003AAE0358
MLDDVPMIPENMVNCALYNGLLFPYPRTRLRIRSQDRSRPACPNCGDAGASSGSLPRSKYHPHLSPCAAGTCRLDFDGLSIYRYRDYHHLSLAGSMKYYAEYRRKHPGELEQLGL